MVRPANSLNVLPSGGPGFEAAQEFYDQGHSDMRPMVSSLSVSITFRIEGAYPESREWVDNITDLITADTRVKDASSTVRRDDLV